MRRWGALSALLLAVALPSVAPAAPCAEAAGVRARLSEAFGERLEREGRARAGHRVELWSNPSRGTWTMLVITPDGLACMAASGRLDDLHSLPALDALV